MLAYLHWLHLAFISTCSRHILWFSLDNVAFCNFIRCSVLFQCKFLVSLLIDVMQYQLHVARSHTYIVTLLFYITKSEEVDQ